MQQQTSQVHAAIAIQAVHGFRYQVTDVARAVKFYTEHLGFSVKYEQLPAFAGVELGGVEVFLTGPGASGSRPMPTGERQTPGGWNRVVLKVENLPDCIAALEDAGVKLRNAMEVGPAGRQIQFEDPDGNPLELFEPAKRS